MNKRSEAILTFLTHGYWMTPSLIHENMETVTWSYNTTLNRLEQLVDDGYVERDSNDRGWYKITEKGVSTVD
jgi:DNA-binding PadR family transcriptional regulator